MKPLRTFAGKKRLPRLVFLLDALVIVLAVCLAQFMRVESIRETLQFYSFSLLILPIVACVALWTMTASKLSLTHLQEFAQLSAIFSRVTIGVFILVPLVMGLAFLTRTMYSRLFFLYLGVLLVFGFTAIRVSLRKIILRFRSQFVLRTVVIGSGRIACEIASKISNTPELLRDLVAFVHPANREMPSFPFAQSSQALTGLSSVKIFDLFAQNDIGEVILATSEPTTAYTHQLISQCRRNGIEVCVIPHTYDLYTSQARVLDLGGLPLVKVESRSPQGLDRFTKRLLDIVLVVPLLALSTPALIVIAATLITKRRSVFDSEQRCGERGRKFRMYRFNIRRHATNLTPFESLLDRLSLTEVPQLWNVLRGDMSLVGPRPEDIGRVMNYSDWQRQRLSMKPGITGLAQVQGLRDEHSSDEKSRYDLQYIHNWSVLVDLSLLVQTAWTLCFRIRDSQWNHRRHRPGPEKPQTPPPANLSLGEADVNRAQSGAD